MSRLRVSLRYKILLVIAGVLLVAMGTYLYLASSLFTQDKLVYIYDLNASLVSSLTEQTRSNLTVMQQELEVFAQEGQKDPAAELFKREPDLLRVQIYRKQGALWTLASSVVHREALELTQLRDEDMQTLRKARPLPLAAVAALDNDIYIQNSSLPPDAAVLTLAYRHAPDVLIAADFRHERLLRIFARSKLHQTFLIDGRGEVLAHPQGARVIEHQDLSAYPLVQAALATDATEGVKEFPGGDDQSPQIGAYGRVGVGRLWVLTQIPKREALRASRELVGRSALFAVAILLTAFIVSVFFSRLLTAPIRSLSAAAERIGQRQFNVDVAVRANDEIGDLARTFQRMAQQLQSTEAQLVQSEKMAAFGQLGAGITHEVKNPMTSIVGFTQLALRKLDDPAAAEELLKLVEQEALRCQEILVNFLKFARAGAGEQAPVQVSEVVQGAARILKHQLNLTGVKLDLDLADGMPTVQGNAAELQQVLLNLAINAQQAMPKGGRVIMKTERRADGVVIEVTDDGPGIPEAIRTKIFEPFFTTKRAGEGTGLGLSVSFGIIKAHKGTIDVTSAEGQGCSFRIQLPLPSLLA